MLANINSISQPPTFKSRTLPARHKSGQTQNAAATVAPVARVAGRISVSGNVSLAPGFVCVYRSQLYRSVICCFADWRRPTPADLPIRDTAQRGGTATETDRGHSARSRAGPGCSRVRHKHIRSRNALRRCGLQGRGPQNSRGPRRFWTDTGSLPVCIS